MKSIADISKETGVESREIYRVMQLQNIIPNKEGKFIRLDKYQEDLIHQYLYYSGKFDKLIIESKINIPEPEPKQNPRIETFEEFKARTYGKAV